MFLNILASSRTSSGPLNQREMVEKKKKEQVLFIPSCPLSHYK